MMLLCCIGLPISNPYFPIVVPKNCAEVLLTDTLLWERSITHEADRAQGYMGCESVGHENVSKLSRVVS